MKIIAEINKDDGGIWGYSFFFPGCKHNHVFYTRPFDSHHVWQFNGNMTNPTFSPSLLNTWTKPPSNIVIKTCHLFVKNGKIEYCGDCSHSLAGQTVDLIDI